MALVAPLSWRRTEQASGIPRTLLTTTQYQLLIFKVKKNQLSLNKIEHLKHATMSRMMKVTVNSTGMRYKMHVVTRKRGFSMISQIDTILPVVHATCQRPVR